VWIWAGAATAVVVVAAAVAAAIIGQQGSRPSLDAVVSSNPSRNHVASPVTYEATPPAGGDHAAVWLNCGIYTAPVRNENAVHSLEHGAVWVTYRPDLPADQVAALKAALPSTYVILSPYPNLPAPVVASAWGKQLSLTDAGDARLGEFVRAYRQGPQTPEPGAACTGGTSGGTTGAGPGM
jgi:hypothetical protein